MLQFNNYKRRISRAIWVIVAVLLVVGCKHTKAVAESLLSGESLVCGKILEGDFESARQIIDKSAISDSQGLRILRVLFIPIINHN